MNNYNGQLSCLKTITNYNQDIFKTELSIRQHTFFDNVVFNIPNGVHVCVRRSIMFAATEQPKWRNA